MNERTINDEGKGKKNILINVKDDYEVDNEKIFNNFLNILIINI